MKERPVSWIAVIGCALCLVFVTAVLVIVPSGRKSKTFTTVRLQGFTNLAFNARWWQWRQPQDNLATFPTGLVRLDGVPYKVSGIIQLHSAGIEREGGRFPDKISGIPLNKKFRTLRLLYGAAKSESTNATIGRIILHSDKETAPINIRYEDHVLDCWFNKDWPVNNPLSKVVWVGSNVVSIGEYKQLRIYSTAFPNPLSNDVIKVFDFVSEMKTAAPFMLGITLEE